MSSNILRPEDRNTLSDASPVGIQKFAHDFGGSFSDGRWLDVNNSYGHDPVRRLARDCKALRVLRSKDLSEYIALSVPLHLVEGWEYLGHALAAQLCGRAHVAIHLGYYAELRAAMSFLAAQGIGVFNYYHCVIDKNGEARCIPSSKRRRHTTHQAVWEYLEHWSSSSAAGSLLGNLIRPGGTPLSDWINAMPCTAEEGWNPVASSLLRDIGLDLNRMRDDRSARNYASYRPWELRSHVDVAVDASIDYLVGAVRLLEPTGSGGFDFLDLQFLRETVRRVFQAKTDLEPQVDDKAYRSEIDGMLKECVEQELISPQMVAEVLTMFQETEPSPFELAFDSSDIGDPRPLLARASILLRIATGVARGFMSDVNMEFSDMSFWWQRRGGDLGLWDSVVEMDDLLDLWGDVIVALEELDDWQATEGSRRELFVDCSFQLYETTNLGRVGMMGLA